MGNSIDQLLEKAQRARREVALLSNQQRLEALEAVAQALESHRSHIVQENAQDCAQAQGLSSALQDRLQLNEARMQGMIDAIRAVAKQEDPLAGRREIGQGKSGIRVTRRRIPLGTIAIVYEARPNVTAECAALTLRSGNVVILRGGKEAKRSNAAIGAAVREGLEKAGVNPDAVIVLAESTRKDVQQLLGAAGKVDLVIPRGGEGLMKMVDQYARVPVIRHGQGICHVYVHQDAELQMAADIAFNAKVHRPGVCNAAETLLVHQDQVEALMGALGPRLKEAGVTLFADPRAQSALQKAGVESQSATTEHWDTEFLSLKLAIRTVDSLNQALQHISTHGTNHSAAIVSQSEDSAEQFLGAVDASCVLWNASTRFNDGGELGLGAEMGISTTRMHAYGPMSVQELTAEKLVVYGSGQVR